MTTRRDFLVGAAVVATVQPVFASTQSHYTRMLHHIRDDARTQQMLVVPISYAELKNIISKRTRVDF